jgi:hypothetical protein
LFALGFFISVYSSFKFTGFVVSQGSAGGYFFIGITLIIGGILLVNFNGQSQLEIELYKDSKNNGGKEKIFMTDPENIFGTEGIVSLDKFKQEMAEIKKDPELLKIVKEAYFFPLMNKLNEKGAESELAKQYLVEMGFESENQEDEKRYALPKSEIDKIKTAFVDKKDRLTSAQKEILKKYNLKYVIPNRGHAKISPEQGGECITMSLSPSDVRTGKNNSSLLVKLCDKQYRKNLYKP